MDPPTTLRLVFDYGGIVVPANHLELFVGQARCLDCESGQTRGPRLDHESYRLSGPLSKLRRSRDSGSHGQRTWNSGFRRTVSRRIGPLRSLMLGARVERATCLDGVDPRGEERSPRHTRRRWTKRDFIPLNGRDGESRAGISCRFFFSTCVKRVSRLRSLSRHRRTHGWKDSLSWRVLLGLLVIIKDFYRQYFNGGSRHEGYEPRLEAGNPTSKSQDSIRMKRKNDTKSTSSMGRQGWCRALTVMSPRKCELERTSTNQRQQGTVLIVVGI